MTMEEQQPIVMDGDVSEAEDLLISDSEDAAPVEESIPLSIDYNARVVSESEKYDMDDGDNCDMHCIDRNLLCRRGSENRLHTSTEDLNISDEEEQCYSTLTLQSVDLDGIASISSKKNTSSFSTLNFSRTGFKKEYSTDAEYMSDEEIGSNMEENFFTKDKHKRLHSGLTFTKLTTTTEAGSAVVIPATEKTLNTLNITNAFTKSLLIDENDMHGLYDEQESPLMTCSEFLKSEINDDCNTDAEDISVGSLGDICETSRQNSNNCEGGCNEFNIPVSVAALSSDNVLHGKENGILYPGDSRRSSTAEFLTEDEIFNLDNFPNSGRKRLKKRKFRLVDKSEVSDDSLTDEEVLELGNKEWTETDDAGGVKQITQIKTETSIKLEGEGDDLGIDGDDIISRTTTTTTRIVTTVTTDGEQESHEDQHILGDGDDLRHSVEVILNQFMSSDSDATKPEDSTTEHDE